MRVKWRFRRQGVKVPRPELSEEALLDRIGVEWDNPLLEAIFWVLADLEDEAQMAAVEPTAKKQRRKEALAMMGAAIEAQRRLRELVDKARKKRLKNVSGKGV